MSTRPAPARRGAFAVACLLSLAAVVALLVRGFDFYLTPAGERARHPDYWDWKAGGTVGHTLGVVGSRSRS